MPFKNARRGVLLTLALLGLGALPATAQTQPFPTRPITLVVPFAAGSGTDISGRLFARALEQELGQPVVVENKVGAAGTVAADYVARAPADGYTLMYLGGGSMTQTFFSRKLNTDILQDLTPVIQLARGSMFLIVRSDLPVNNAREFLEYVRKSPGKYNYASVAATQMMPMEVLKDIGKLQMTHIPYKSAAQYTQAFESKDIVAIAGNSTSNEAQLAAGKLRYLMVFGNERNPNFPDVPSAAEMGLSGVDAPYTFAVWAPAKTPAPVVARLNAALNAALKKPEIVTFIKNSGGIVGGGPPQVQFDAIKREHEYWARAAKVANFTPE